MCHMRVGALVPPPGRARASGGQVFNALDPKQLDVSREMIDCFAESQALPRPPQQPRPSRPEAANRAAAAAAAATPCAPSWLALV